MCICDSSHDIGSCLQFLLFVALGERRQENLFVLDIIVLYQHRYEYNYVCLLYVCYVLYLCNLIIFMWMFEYIYNIRGKKEGRKRRWRRTRSLSGYVCVQYIVYLGGG